MWKWFQILYPAQRRKQTLAYVNMRVHYIFQQIFSYDIIFYHSHGHLKNLPCFLKQEKNYIRMEIRSTAFLAIAIAITVLNNKYRTKNSLLWWKILMALWYQGHKGENSAETRCPTKLGFQDWKTKPHQVSAEFWPLYHLILRSVHQRSKILNKHFSAA